MTPKRFWMLFTLAGALMFVAGLVLTIVLVIETGEERLDSECDSTMGATVLTYTCVTSSDPKVLLGVAPLMLGIGMAVWGGIKWTGAASSESMSDGGSDGLLGSVPTLQQVMDSTTTAPPPGSAPPPAPPGSPPLKS